MIRDRQGRVVTEINMTAIPVDRPPFPVPDLGVPVYFTVQPGGAVLQSVTGKPGPGARLFYPNFKNEVPGARGTFWNYDPEDREWFVYGMGTISRDATQAIPDDGVVIHELTGAMFDGGNTPGPNGPPPCADNMCCAGDDSGPGGSGGNMWSIDAEPGGGTCGLGGDPVSLFTGQFDYTEHDVMLDDLIPIDIARTYNSADKNQRAFGIGMTDAYDVFLSRSTSTRKSTSSYPMARECTTCAHRWDRLQRCNLPVQRPRPVEPVDRCSKQRAPWLGSDLSRRPQVVFLSVPAISWR